MGRTMGGTAPKAARLQAIRDNWFLERLQVPVPKLTADIATPATCDEFVRSPHLQAGFSSLHLAPESAGLSAEEALAQDEELNTDRFGVPDPARSLHELSDQFRRMPDGQVEPDVLKKGAVVLDALKDTSLELASAAVGDDAAAKVVQAAHHADAAACAQAQGLLRELARELGVSLPLNRGKRRGE